MKFSRDRLAYFEWAEPRYGDCDVCGQPITGGFEGSAEGLRFCLRADCRERRARLEAPLRGSINRLRDDRDDLRQERDELVARVEALEAVAEWLWGKAKEE